MAAFDFKKGLKELSQAATATAKGLKVGATVFAEEITKDMDLPSVDEIKENAKGFSQEAFETAKSLKDGVTDFAEDVTKNINAPSVDEIIDGAKEFSQSAVETAKNLAVGVTDFAGDAKEAVSDAIESLKGEEEVDTEALEFKVVSAKSAMMIVYCMMAADGEIFHSEEEKFDSVGVELDSAFADDKEVIVSECKALLNKKADSDDYLAVLKKCIEEALAASKPGTDDRVPSKLLVWNLLAIAYSDGHFDDAEIALLEYILERINVDSAVFREMESSLLTIIDIDREISWIKTTDKPYLTIEPIVIELENRKRAIIKSVEDLISL